VALNRLRNVDFARRFVRKCLRRESRVSLSSEIANLNCRVSTVSVYNFGVSSTSETASARLRTRRLKYVLAHAPAAIAPASPTFAFLNDKRASCEAPRP
jgi:hypothetical protein